jgi:hypothetical protein
LPICRHDRLVLCDGRSNHRQSARAKTGSLRLAPVMIVWSSVVIVWSSVVIVWSSVMIVWSSVMIAWSLAMIACAGDRAIQANPLGVKLFTSDVMAACQDWHGWHTWLARLWCLSFPSPCTPVRVESIIALGLFGLHVCVASGFDEPLAAHCMHANGLQFLAIAMARLTCRECTCTATPPLDELFCPALSHRRCLILQQ